MSDSALIISSEKISNNDLKKLISLMGGSVVSEMNLRLVVVDQDTNLWVSLLDKSLALKFYDDENYSEWEKVLGAKAQSLIELNFDHTPLCHQLYLYVAYELGQVWHVVLDDIDDSIIGYDEVVLRYKQNCQDLTLDKVAKL